VLLETEGMQADYLNRGLHSHRSFVEKSAEMLHLFEAPTWTQRIWYPASGAYAGKHPAGLAITMFGRMQSRRGFRLRQTAKFHALHFFNSGRGFIRVNGVEQEVGPGDVFVFYPGNDYDYGDFKGQRWDYHWADLEGRDVAQALRHVGITPRTPRFDGLAPGDWGHFFERIQPRFAAAATNHAFAAAAAWELIDMLESARRDSRPRTLGEAARLLMDRSNPATLHVEKIAAELGVSRSTLFREFTRTHGLAPKRYIDSLRLAKAERLLHQPGIRLKEIAAACGFSSPQYFIRVFQARHGRPPKRWRTVHGIP
jgi:AraC-like DNA-binding protein